MAADRRPAIRPDDDCTEWNRRPREGFPMPTNRISHLFGTKTSRRPSSPPAPPTGFAAVAVAPLAQLDVRCQNQRSVYEMAYLFARMGYVVGE